MTTKKPSHKKAPLWIFLWILAGVILVPVLKPFFIAYNVITILYRTYVTKVYLKGTLTFYFKRMSIVEDQVGNVYGNDMINDFMLKKDTPRYYGFVDETISSATGKAKLREHLGKKGQGVDDMLEFFEKDHSVKSIEEDEGIKVVKKKKRGPYKKRKKPAAKNIQNKTVNKS